MSSGWTLIPSPGADPLNSPPIIVFANSCVRSRDYQTCGGGDSVGWNGYYCNDGPVRHHKERTQGKLGGRPQSCPNVGATVEKNANGLTKILSKDRPCTYYNSWSW
jgi:hypothetical protein